MWLILIIMGQKNAELAGTVTEDQCPLRARAVFQGSNVFTGGGTPAWMLYQESGATPSNMATAHCAMGVGALKGSEATTRDAKKAYIQSEPGRPRTWVRMLKFLWPKSWFNSDGSPKYKDPVCILKRSLYGHPESGPIWDKKMTKCMRMAGFVPLEGSPGFFYHPAGYEMVVYVDFILISPPHLTKQIWAELDKVIEFKDPPVPVDRFLGIYHKTVKLTDGTVKMNTSAEQYLIEAVKNYLKEAGCGSLAWVPSPSLDDRFDKESALPGKFAASAASHLMKLLYVARLCRGDILVTTTFLARRISRWSKDEDRRLHRLMAYCWHHVARELVHEMHPDDFERHFLITAPMPNSVETFIQQKLLADFG